jgi:hypothetical protein
VKVESRGKYAGVKVHLDTEECEVLMGMADATAYPTHAVVMTTFAVPLKLARKMGQSIKELLSEQPGLLKERTPEQIAAILAKESEKAGIQLNRLKNGKDWKKIEPEALKAALLHHVKE